MAEENKMKFTTPRAAFLEMNPYLHVYLGSTIIRQVRVTRKFSFMLITCKLVPCSYIERQCKTN